MFSLSSLKIYAIIIGGMLLVNYLVENPLIRANARQGYVTVATLAASEALAAEWQRQLDAAKISNEAFREAYRQLRDANKKADEDAEALIQKYAAERAAAGDVRSYRLNATDIKRVRDGKSP